MSAVATSAAELLGGTSPTKKQRPLWPSDVPLKPHYPGAGFARHPVDKAFISLADAKALGAKEEASAPAPAPLPEAAKEPEQIPQPKEEVKTAPENPQSGAPDFSDLPKSDGTGGPQPGNESQPKEPTAEEVKTAYTRMAEMFFAGFVNLLSAIFGDFWLPRNAEEMRMVTGAIVDYFNSIAIAAFTPLENLWMAVGMYCMPRLPKTAEKIVSWWKGRKGKRRPAPQPENTEKKSEQPIEVEAEVVRGPGV